MTEKVSAVESSWMDGWQRVARRIRVPLGFASAAVYLVELWRRPPYWPAILVSLLLVVPGVWLRGYAAGYVKKNRELTRTGPYAHTRNPLYLGSILIAAGFAVALESWWFALVLVVFFVVIYVPVIRSEERFLRATFADFDEYCAEVPRLLPRITAAKSQSGGALESDKGSFSAELYGKHREYNALIGALCLYASLGLRLALAFFWHR